MRAPADSDPCSSSKRLAYPPMARSPYPEPRMDAIVPPGVTAAEVAPSPTSLPEAVSSGPAGREFRGACPNRTFSRFTFCGFCGLAAEVAVAVGARRSRCRSRCDCVDAAAEAGAAAAGAADLAAVDVDLLAVEYFVPRSNRFFCCAVFFFATGGAYAVNTGLVSFGLAPESTYPARISMYASSRSFVR